MRVQTAIQRLRNGVGVPPGFTSPTWAVDLRVFPVARGSPVALTAPGPG